MSLAALRHDVVILACAISAGIHGALVPEHLAEGRGLAFAFAVSAASLAAAAAALTLRPASGRAVATAALLLAGPLVAYAAAATSGLPLLHPEPEAVTGLGLATKAVEAAGLLAASSLLRHRAHRAAPAIRPKGRLT